MILPFKVFPKNIYSKNSTHTHTHKEVKQPINVVGGGCWEMEFILLTPLCS